MPPTTTSSLRGVRPDILGALMDVDPTDPMIVQPIADRVFVPTQVNENSGDYGRVKRESLLAMSGTGGKRKANAKTQEISLELDSLFFKTEEHAFKSFLDQQTRAYYDTLFDFEIARSKMLYGQLLREREARAAALVHNTTTFPLSGTTGLSVTNEWDDAANATPVDDVQVGMEAIYAKTGMRPNRFQCHWQTLLDLSRTNQVVERFKYTSIVLNAGRPKREDIEQLSRALAPVIGVEEIVVPMAPQNTADEGQTFSGGDIWSQEYAFLYYANESRAPETPNLGRTFYFPGNGGLLTARSWQEDDPPGDYVAVQDDTDERIVDSAFGFLFGNMVT